MDYSKCVKSTLKAMADFLDVTIQNEREKEYTIPNNLANLIEIELIYKEKNSGKKIKSLNILIRNISENKWMRISADDLRSFFLPIFNSNYIKK